MCFARELQRSVLRVDELLANCLAWVEPCVDSLWLICASLFKENDGFLWRLHSVVRNCKDRREDLILLSVEDLNDVPIRKRIRKSEYVLPCRQDCPRNLDSLAERQNRFLIPLVPSTGKLVRMAAPTNTASLLEIISDDSFRSLS